MQQVVEAFATLQVPVRERIRGREIRTQEQADAVGEELVSEALANFRRLIKSAHPDAGGSKEQAQALTNAKDIVEHATFRPIPPPRLPRWVIWHYPGGTGASSTTATTFTWTQ